MPDPVYTDPFSGELVTPNPLNVTDEQKDLIRQILDLSSSDSRFALKAYLAIMKILLGEDITPVILSLDPTEGNSGVSNLALTVHGTDFEAGSRVQQAGVVIPTSFVDDTELTATVNLSGAAPGVIAISVRNSNGLTSNAVNLDVLDPLTLLEQDGIIGSLSADREDRNAHGQLNLNLDQLVDTEDEQPVVDPPNQVSDVPADDEYDKLKAQIASFNQADLATSEPAVDTSETGDTGKVSSPTNQFDADQSGGTSLKG